jgi:hypothetical protein
MSDTLYVTPAQVLAAKLVLELREEAGEPLDEALQAIANAQVVVPPQSAPSHRTGVDEEALAESRATLQRIEHQLQRLNPEPSGQERSQPPQARTPGNVDPQDIAPASLDDPDLDPPWPSEELQKEWSEAARPSSWGHAESREQPAGVNPDDSDAPPWAREGAKWEDPGVSQAARRSSTPPPKPPLDPPPPVSGLEESPEEKETTERLLAHRRQWLRDQRQQVDPDIEDPDIEGPNIDGPGIRGPGIGGP